ncbi:transporter [Jiulongibacter sediminis]|uniref:transporter n=1 Tax=Jiulongibacter sediminis TaxID=1605367 RepID=UPI0026F06FE8|nr:transporter [Jiulongibacter sediminis]
MNIISLSPQAYVYGLEVFYKNQLYRLLLLLAITMLSFTLAKAQTPDDAILMNSGEACVLLNYSDAQFDHYWEGSGLRVNETIATVSRNTVMPMIAVGIIPRLNFYIATPYVQTSSSNPNGGRFAGASGLQDLSLAAKYELIHKESKVGNFSALASIGFSTPMSNYLSDYMPYSLGLGTPQFNYSAIAQYGFKKGPYLRLSGAYLWRGYTEAERDYYYNGGSFYTPWMDVPNAFAVNGVLGSWLFGNRIKLEANLNRFQSLSGDDIRAYNAAQPTNKVETTSAGILGQYYPKNLKGLGFVVNHMRTLSGRNTGKLNSTSIGLTYQFGFLKKEK